MPVQYWYYAALALVVLPSLAFNRQAVVVIAAWLLGQFAYVAGISFIWFDAASYAAGAVISFMIARKYGGIASTLVAVLFVGMAMVDALAVAGRIAAYPAYWWGFGLAITQALILPFGNDWNLVREGWVAMRDDSMFDNLLRRVVPWTS